MISYLDIVKKNMPIDVQKVQKVKKVKKRDLSESTRAYSIPKFIDAFNLHKIKRNLNNKHSIIQITIAKEYDFLTINFELTRSTYYLFYLPIKDLYEIKNTEWNEHLYNLYFGSFKVYPSKESCKVKYELFVACVPTLLYQIIPTMSPDIFISTDDKINYGTVFFSVNNFSKLDSINKNMIKHNIIKQKSIFLGELKALPPYKGDTYNFEGGIDFQIAKKKFNELY